MENLTSLSILLGSLTLTIPLAELIENGGEETRPNVNEPPSGSLACAVNT